MAVPHGYALFPGVTQILSCTYTMTQGIQPSVAIIEMAPQGNFPAEGGTLTFLYGNIVIKLADCRVDKASVRLDERGQIVSLQIFDRRWKWAYPTISGYYNYTDLETGPVNTIIPANVVVGTQVGRIDRDRARNAQQLARLCLEEMGERNFDISALPTNVFPAVDWECENAATALQSVAEKCGCVVAMRINGTVLVAKEGVGSRLPTSPLLDGGVTVDPPQTPDQIEIVCGPTLYQWRIPLEPVGLDIDGLIKPIDFLSYKPAAGWSSVDPIGFGGLTGDPEPASEVDPEIRHQSPRYLAQRTVWRWYSVYCPPAGLEIPGFGKIYNINQILPLNSFRIDRITVADCQRRREAEVIGSWADRQGTTANSKKKRYYRPFDIDEQRGIVMFSEVVHKYGGTARNWTLIPADMELHTSFSIRVPPTWAKDRFISGVSLAGARWDTGPKQVVKDDVVREVRAVYNKFGQFVRIATNDNEIMPQLNYYRDSEVATYQVSGADQATFAGLLPISLDGAIRQVCWQITDRGTITSASRNCEFSTVIPPYEMRRRWDQIRRVVDFSERRPNQ